MTTNSGRNEYGELGRVYLGLWISGLRLILGWPEERTRAWAQERWAKYLETDDEMFFHDTPEYYIAAAIIHHLNVAPEVGTDVGLLNALEQALRDPEMRASVFDYTDEDWREARMRARSVLRERGIDLPADPALQEDVDDVPTSSRRLPPILSYRVSIRIEVDPEPPSPDIYPISYPDVWSAFLEAVRLSQESGEGSAKTGHYLVAVSRQDWKFGHLRPPIGKEASLITNLTYKVSVTTDAKTSPEAHH